VPVRHPGSPVPPVRSAPADLCLCIGTPGGSLALSAIRPRPSGPARESSYVQCQLGGSRPWGTVTGLFHRFANGVRAHRDEALAVLPWAAWKTVQAVDVEPVTSRAWCRRPGRDVAEICTVPGIVALPGFLRYAGPAGRRKFGKPGLRLCRFLEQPSPLRAGIPFDAGPNIGDARTAATRPAMRCLSDSFRLGGGNRALRLPSPARSVGLHG
jgi:hypothetical protein